MKDKKGKHERSTEVMLPRPLLPIPAFMVGYQVPVRGLYSGLFNTYRTRKALRPLKAPSVMWLMALWPRRRLCRSPSTDRLPSSKRVRLLYDRFLEVDIKGETEGGGKKDGSV